MREVFIKEEEVEKLIEENKTLKLLVNDKNKLVIGNSKYYKTLDSLKDFIERYYNAREFKLLIEGVGYVKIE